MVTENEDGTANLEIREPTTNEEKPYIFNIRDSNGNIHSLPMNSIEQNQEVVQERFWPVVAIILCCAEIEVSYSQSEGWSGSAGFNCDCF